MCHFLKIIYLLAHGNSILDVLEDLYLTPISGFHLTVGQSPQKVMVTIIFTHEILYKKPEKCRKETKSINRPLPIKSQIIAYQDTSVEKLKYLISAFGPVSVNVDANVPSFQTYKDGIYSDLACSKIIFDRI